MDVSPGYSLICLVGLGHGEEICIVLGGGALNSLDHMEAELVTDVSG